MDRKADFDAFSPFKQGPQSFIGSEHGEPSSGSFPHKVDTESLVKPSSSDGGGESERLEPKPLCGRVITYICIPVVFIVGTVVTPLIEVGNAARHLIGLTCLAVCCPCFGPCVLIPGIIVFAIDIVGGVAHGVFTGGYRLVMKTLDPDNYEYYEGRFPSLSEKYAKCIEEIFKKNDEGDTFV